MESCIENSQMPPDSPMITNAAIRVADDVFGSADDDDEDEETAVAPSSTENSEQDTNKNSNLLCADQVLPRKSSLIKDPNRRNRRKKTVSFSSMPGERVIVNGN